MPSHKSQQKFLVERVGANEQGIAAMIRSEKMLIAAIGVAIALQLWLVFVKGINWDEFLHFGQVYDLTARRLTSGLQTLVTRMVAWTVLISVDVVQQIQAARIVMLICEIITMVIIIALARQFSSRQTALLTGFVYVTAGYVFTQAFSYRPDPVSAALLMGALWLFAKDGLSLKRAFVIGFLIGLAGALTMKAVFYAPCFAGYAWLRLRDPLQRAWPEFVKLMAIPSAAAAFFVGLIALHSMGIVDMEDQAVGVGSRMDNFVGSGLFQQGRYIVTQAALAPLVTLSLIMLPLVIRGRKNDEKIVLAAFVAPLLCLIFYRNTFPYFFTFLLPPICVALAPVLDKLVQRYKLVPVMLISIAGPAVLITKEPYDILGNQRATIAEIERLFPEPTGYFSYSNYIPHYPRQFPSLLSGVGLQRYIASGDKSIARNIKEGRIAFVIVTGDVLEALYDPKNQYAPLPKEDANLLLTNYLEYNKNIRILGKNICYAPSPQSIHIYREGLYTIDGGTAQIDGHILVDGETKELLRGKHQVSFTESGCIKLWALGHVPRLSSGVLDGPLANGF